jgi:hypothetical protein
MGGNSVTADKLWFPEDPFVNSNNPPSISSLCSRSRSTSQPSRIDRYFCTQLDFSRSLPPSLRIRAANAFPAGGSSSASSSSSAMVSSPPDFPLFASLGPAVKDVFLLICAIDILLCGFIPTIQRPSPTRTETIEATHFALDTIKKQKSLCVYLKSGTHGGLVLSCLIRATGWANAPRWGGRLRCWLAPPPPTTSNLDLQCGADRHPSSPFALSGSSVGQRGTRVSLAYKILTANHVLIMQQINPKGLHHTTDECSIRVPQMSGRQF